MAKSKEHCDGIESDEMFTNLIQSFRLFHFSFPFFFYFFLFHFVWCIYTKILNDMLDNVEQWQNQSNEMNPYGIDTIHSIELYILNGQQRTFIDNQIKIKISSIHLDQLFIASTNAILTGYRTI